jgi:phosphoribosylanthranilate isomerase
MKIKICGLKHPQNINEIADLKPDYMGFIFYKQSKRNVDNELILPTLKKLPKTIKKIGVFVNEKTSIISNLHLNYQFDYIQLHGDENEIDCKELKEKNLKIIKAFSIDEKFEFNLTISFEPYCDYFLFDTKSKLKGGNGITFNWELLNKYYGKTPFFLSGGIGPENLIQAINIKHPLLAGLDMNSKLELSEGLKNIELTKNCITQVRTSIYKKEKYEHTTK